MAFLHPIPPRGKRGKKKKGKGKRKPLRNKIDMGSGKDENQRGEGGPVCVVPKHCRRGKERGSTEAYRQLNGGGRRDRQNILIWYFGSSVAERERGGDSVLLRLAEKEEEKRRVRIKIKSHQSGWWRGRERGKRGIKSTRSCGYHDGEHVEEAGKIDGEGKQTPISNREGKKPQEEGGFCRALPHPLVGGKGKEGERDFNW